MEFDARADQLNPLRGNGETDWTIRDIRKVLWMVVELQNRGYELLRIFPTLADSGGWWRCTFPPAKCVSNNDGTAMPEVPDSMWAGYSTIMGRNFFRWQNVAECSPAELSDRYLLEFPTLCRAGKGLDPEYTKWLREVLVITEPGFLPYFTYPGSVATFPYDNGQFCSEIPKPPVGKKQFKAPKEPVVKIFTLPVPTNDEGRPLSISERIEILRSEHPHDCRARQLVEIYDNYIAVGKGWHFGHRITLEHVILNSETTTCSYKKD